MEEPPYIEGIEWIYLINPLKDGITHYECQKIFKNVIMN